MLDHHPRKRFGQHFLHQNSVIERIISTFNPKESDVVVEIGPGQGALTFLLVERVKELHLLELDRDLANWLSQEFATRSHVTIHQADALQTQLCTVTPHRPLRIIGNLPYNISTPLLFHLIEQLPCIQDMLFMLQKEVVDRLVAEPHSKDYGRLSVMCQLECEIDKCFDVAPGAFSPPPKVDSAVVLLRPRRQPLGELKDKTRFAQIVNQAFTQRRKMLRKSLKGFVSDAAFELAGVTASERPEDLQVADFIRLSNAAA